MEFLKKHRSLLIIVALLIIPFLLANPFITHLFVRAVTFSIVVMGFTLFVGYTGQISLGHAAFYGLGAYIAGILAKQGVPFFITLLIAVGIVAFIGFCIGLIVLRTSGHYLALSSIAVAMIIYVLIINSSITGGPSGLTGIPKPEILGWSINSGLSFYLLASIFLIISLIAIRRIINSRTGDALRAIANNELAAESLGIPIYRYKVLSFTISTSYAAIAGVLFAYYDGYISPDILNINLSILFLIMAYIGGIGNIYGSIIGAFTIVLVEEYARNFSNFHVLVYGFILVLIIMFMPKGLIGLPEKIKEIFLLKNRKKEESKSLEPTIGSD